MPACNSCGVETPKRKNCQNQCGAMLCSECVAPPEGWPGDYSTVLVHGAAFSPNRCRFCRRRGEPLNGAEFKNLKVGDWFWVIWCKDGNPEDCRFNCPQRIESFEEGDVVCADWSFTGKGHVLRGNQWAAPYADDYHGSDTSRGCAYLFHFKHPDNDTDG